MGERFLMLTDIHVATQVDLQLVGAGSLISRLLLPSSDLPVSYTRRANHWAAALSAALLLASTSALFMASM